MGYLFISYLFLCISFIQSAACYVAAKQYVGLQW